MDYTPVMFCARLVVVTWEVFTTTSTREIQICARPATQLTGSFYFRQIVHASPLHMREDLSERWLFTSCFSVVCLIMPCFTAVRIIMSWFDVVCIIICQCCLGFSVVGIITSCFSFDWIMMSCFGVGCMILVLYNDDRAVWYWFCTVMTEGCMILVLYSDDRGLYDTGSIQ